MPGGDGYLVQNMGVKTMISLMYKVPVQYYVIDHVEKPSEN
jgi:hypothetical protein